MGFDGGGADVLLDADLGVGQSFGNQGEDTFKVVVIPSSAVTTFSMLLIAVSMAVPLLALAVPRRLLQHHPLPVTEKKMVVRLLPEGSSRSSRQYQPARRRRARLWSRWVQDNPPSVEEKVSQRQEVDQTGYSQLTVVP